MSLFINGNLVAQSPQNTFPIGTVWSTYTSTTQLYIGHTAFGSYTYFKGYISNLRWEQGNLDTSVYQSNFTVPTAPLLAVSGTILLTLQNSTLLDNSTNTYQLIPSGSAAMVTYPQPFYTNLSWLSVTAGDSHTMAVRADGTLWTWGFNNYGQLGIGNLISRSSPVQIGASTSWAGFKVNTIGTSQSVQLDANGIMYLWGYNGYGQLGDGTVTSRSSPVQVSVGQYSSPVQIGVGYSWSQVAAGDYHSAAIRSDGTLWSWGNNNVGQLGQSNTYSNFSPIQVFALSNSWSQVSAGGSHTLAIDSNNTLWTWGYNAQGQLGDGTTTNRSYPIPIGATGISNYSAYSIFFNSALSQTVAVSGSNNILTLGSGNFTIEAWVYPITNNGIMGIFQNSSQGLFGTTIITFTANATVNVNYLTGVSQSAYYITVGASITGTYIPAGTIITGFNPSTATVYMNNYATATVSSQTYTVYGGSGGYGTALTTLAVSTFYNNWQIYANGTIYTSTSNFNINQWYHVALVRNANVINLYINGVSVIIYPDTYFYGGTYFGIGDLNGPISYFNGYITNVRYVIGYGVYTGTFTPPTSPLTTTQTSGTNINAITYNAPTINYYLTFNGSNQYITTPTTFVPIQAIGTADFTMEAWVYQTAQPTFGNVITNRSTDTVAGKVSMGFRSGVLEFYSNSATVLSTNVTTPNNVWVHAAVTRISGIIRVFLNGIQQNGTATYSTSIQAATYAVGATTSGTEFFSGYISNARVVSGTGIYSVNFTVPSNALTTTQSATTNIGAITGVTPTNGNSILFNGTSAYLTVPGSAFVFGTNPFNIECWVYPTTFANSPVIIDNFVSGPSGSYTVGEWQLYINTGGTLIFAFATSTTTITNAITSGTVYVNTWNHVTVGRSSSSNTMYMYVNGTGTGASGSINISVGINLPSSIGRQTYNNTSFFAGYISNIRINNGNIIYTGTYVVPTSPLAITQNAGTNIAAITGGTVLLTGQSSTIIDNSINALTITNNGATVSTIGPFGSGTILLVGQASTIIDSSVNAFTITNVGTVTNLSPGPLNGQFGTALLTAQNSVFRDNSVNNLTITSTSSPVAVYATPFSGVTLLGASSWTQVAAGGSHSVAIASNISTVYAWGYNNYGQLASNDIVNRSSPTAVAGGLLSNQSAHSYLFTAGYGGFPISNTSALNFTAGQAFTIEMWVYPTVANNNTYFFNWGTYKQAYPSEAVVTIGYTGATIYISGGSNTTSTSYALSYPSSVTLSANTWYHIALVRTAANLTTVYLNGVGGTPVTVAGAAQPLSARYDLASPNGMWFGVNTTNQASFSPATYTGYISNFRYTQGTAVYTANFTVPTSPLATTQTANANGNPSAAIASGVNLLTFDTAIITQLTSDNIGWVLVSGFVGTLESYAFPSSFTGVTYASGVGLSATFISAGQYHTIAYSTANSLLAWGMNTTAQLGDGTQANRSSPVQVTSAQNTLSNTNAYSTSLNWGYLGTTAVPANFGFNNFTIESWIFFPILSAYNINLMSNIGQYDNNGWTLALNTNNYFVFGFQGTGTTTQSGVNSSGSWTYSITTSTAPTVNAWTHVAVVRNNTTITLFVNGTSAGTVTVAGSLEQGLNNGFYIGYYPYMGGQLGNNTIPASGPLAIASGAGSNVYMGNFYYSNVRLVNGVAVYTGTFTVPTSPLTAIQSSGTNISAILTGQTTLLTCQNSTIVDNSTYGHQIFLGGNPARTTLLSPFSSYVTVGQSSWTTVNAGSSMTMGIRSDGTLWGWGYNNVGQLGEITNFNRSTMIQLGVGQGTNVNQTILSPVQISTKSWTQVSAGNQFNVGIDSNNLLWGWGYNGYGQLGDSTIINRSSPVQIGSSSWTQVNATYSNTVALRSDGGLFVWGSNTYGMINDDTIYSRSSPVQVGNATLTNTGNYSVLFGSSLLPTTNNMDYFGVSLIAPFASNFGSNNFTIEFWAFPVNLPTAAWIPMVSIGTAGSIGAEIRIGQNINSAGLGFLVPNSGSDIYAGYGVMGINQWTHLALVRSSASSTILYSNGVALGTQTVNYTFPNIGWIRIGADPYADGTFNGYISNLRIVLGQALYTPTSVTAGTQYFNPPTQTLTRNTVGTGGTNVATAITGQVTLLTCQSNTFVDNSIYNNPLTLTKNPQISSFNPFNNNYYSGQFNGSTNYLSMTSGTSLQLSGQTFTIEAWIYLTSYTPVYGSNYWVNILNTYAGSTSGYEVDVTGTASSYTALQFISKTSGTATNTVSKAFTFSLSTWYHIAITTSGTTMTMYVNGTSIGTATITTWTDTTTMYIGSTNIASAQYWFPGFISNLRIVKGVAVYIGTFTLPSNQLTAIQSSGTNISALTYGQTQLLTLQTGGIVDLSYNQTPITNNNNVLTNNYIVPPVFLNVNNYTGYSSYTSIGAGINNALTIRNDNTIWGWGYNWYGQLGNGNIYNQNFLYQSVTISPTQVYTAYPKLQPNRLSNTSSWSVIGAGLSHTLAIRTDGTLWGWGYNGVGQLANTTTQPALTFAQPTYGSSGYFNVALTASNALWVWGYGLWGNLGFINAAGSISTPQLSTYGNSWSQLSAGDYHVLAIKPSDKSLWVWGYNNAGQLGDTTTTSRSSPVQLHTGSWNQVYAGVSWSSAIRNDNAVFVWGANTYGELGDNTTVSKSSPVMISAQLYPSAPNVANQYSTYFNGSTGYLTVPTNTVFLFGTGDYTVEAWLFPTSSSATMTFFGGGVANTPVFSITALTAIVVNPYGTAAVNGSQGCTQPYVFNTYTWYHVAITRQSGITRIFVNGGQIGLNVNDPTSYVQGAMGIGATQAASQFFPGYISNLRVIKGQALYTATFTVPTSALTNNTVGTSGTGVASSITGTVALLTCQNFTPYDNSGNSFVISMFGVTYGTYAYSPFAYPYYPTFYNNNPNAGGPLLSGLPSNSLGYSQQYNFATGGSNVATNYNYDYLSINQTSVLNIGTTGTFNFTFEWWMFTPAFTYQMGLFGKRANESAYAPFVIYVNTSGQIIVSMSTTGTTFTPSALTSTISMQTYIWYHVAVVRNGTAVNIYFNGISVASGTINSGALMTNTNQMVIGIDSSAWTVDHPYSGFLTNIRVIDNQALYTANFNVNITPITSPTTIVNTGAGVAGSITGSVVLLTAQNNTFIDNSSNALTLIQNHTLTTSTRTPFTSLYNTSWKQLVSGKSHTVALRSDGLLFTWGYNPDGELGDGSVINRSSPVQIPSGSWTQISTQDYTVFAINTVGQLWGWGYQNNGQLGDNTNTPRSSPVQIGVGSSWNSVYSGSSFSVAIRSDGTLWGWGLNGYGQLGLNTTNSMSSPVQISASSYTQVMTGASHVVVQRSDGTLWAWGYNTDGELGDGTTVAKSSPVQVISGLIYTSSPVQISTSSWIAVSAGDSHSVALRSDYTIWGWGSNMLGQLGITGSTLSTAVIGGGASFTAFINGDGRLWTWGNNGNGQLGQLNTSTYSSPAVIGFYSWTSLSVGQSHMLAIRSDSTLWAWGYNGVGQLGTNDTVSRSSPVLVNTSTWSQVATYNSHTLAIRSDGTLWGWGSNNVNQLSLSWAQIQVGFDGHINALRSDGTLWGWGYNNVGQIGNNNTTNYSVPQAVYAANYNNLKVIQFSVGGSHTAAITSDNRLWTWGNNSYGQLGVNGGNQSTPTNVGGSWTQVTAGLYHTLGIKTDGSVWAWGNNTYGQVSDITYNNNDGISAQLNYRSGPVLVAPLGTSLPNPLSYSVFFNGVSDWVQFPLNATTQLSTFDFTVECWVYIPFKYQSSQCIWSNYASQANVASMSLWATNSSVTTTGYALWINSNWYIITTTNVIYAQWTHLAVVRNVGNVNIYVNGVAAVGGGPASLPSVSVNGNGSYWTIGNDGTSVTTSSFFGFISNFRIIKGQAIYGNGPLNIASMDNYFIPSTTPLTTSTVGATGSGVANALTGTVIILTLQNNYFVDNSINNFQISTIPQGSSGSAFYAYTPSPTIRAWSPFYTSRWNASKVIAGNSYSMVIDTTNKLWVMGNNQLGQLGTNDTVNRYQLTPWNGSYTYSTTGYSLDFNGGNYLTATASTFTFGAANFTIEFWCYVTRYNTTMGILGKRASESAFGPFNITMSSTGAIIVNMSNNGTTYAVSALTSTIVVPLFTWTHFAVTRVSTTVYMYMNGILMANTGTISGALTTNIASLSIGIDSNTPATNNPFNGLISNMRLTDGQALYTGTTANINYFTYTPVAPFTTSTVGVVGAGVAGSLTGIVQLLIGQNATVIDNSTNAYTFTNVSNVTTLNSVPFANLYTYTTDPTSWTQISASFTGHNLAIKSNGTLWVWGNNFAAELGLGDQFNRSSPVQLGTSSWTSVSAGANYSTAIDINNKLWAWGDNTYIQTGIQNTQYLSWTTVSLGGSAKHSDGTLWSWGDNRYGQLGYTYSNTTNLISRSSPVQINTGLGLPTNQASVSWSQISTSISHSLAIRSDGTLWSWGSNSWGQLGTGDFGIRYAPTQIAVNYNIGNPTAYSTFFNGPNGDYLTVTNTTFVLANSYQPFTIEGWVYPITNNGGAILTEDVASTINFTLAFGSVIGNTDTIANYVWFGSWNGSQWINSVISPFQIPLNQWSHIAGVFNGYSSQLYVNGILVATQLSTSGWLSGTASSAIYIGRRWDTSGNPYFNGYLSNVRMVIGVAVYTGNFTVPTSPLTATQSAGTNISAITGTQTKLLVCQNGGFYLDNSTNAYQVTRSGTPYMTAFTPFTSTVTVTALSNWTQVYAGSSHSAALRSDGSLWTWGLNNAGQLGIGDTNQKYTPQMVGATTLSVSTAYSVWFSPFTNGYIQIANSTPLTLAGISWTIEAWVYPVNFTAASIIYSKRVASSATTEIQLYLLVTTGYISAYNGTTTYSSTSAPLLNTWSHIAYTYDGTTIYFYLNGVFVYSSAVTITARVTPITIGTELSGSFNQIYMSNLRVTNGQRLYTGTTLYTQYFTPSLTTPLTTSTVGATGSGAASSITGTVALLTLQNNTFKDNSSNNYTLTPVSVVTSAFTPFYGVTPSGQSWTQVGVGTSNMAAVRSDNSLWAWGYNGQGQLGTGDILPRTQANPGTGNSLPTDASSYSASNILTRNGTTFMTSVTQYGITTLATPFATPGSTGFSSYFDGTTGYYTIPTSTQLNLSSATAWTIEAWVYWTGINASAQILEKDGVFSTSNVQYGLQMNGSGYVALYIGSGNGVISIQNIASNTLLPLNQWVHVAGVLNSATLYLYQNGIQVATAAKTATITDGGKAVYIGYQSGQSTASFWSGYISNVRIVNGVAVYTGTYTVPITPLTISQSSSTNISAILSSQTSLLTLQTVPGTLSNWTQVSSGDSHTVAVRSDNTLWSWGNNNYGQVGDATVTLRSSPVQVSASVTTNAYVWNFTSSGYYLYMVNPNFNVSNASTQFCFEFWVLPVSGLGLLAIGNGAAYGNSILFQWTGSVFSFYQNNGSNGQVISLSSNAVYPANVWYHLAATKDNTGTVRLFVNGNLVASGVNTGSTAIPAGTTLVINGLYDNNGLGYNGSNMSMSNLRVVIGNPVYTANFTPSTIPLTATQSANVYGSPSAAITSGQTVLLTAQNPTYIDNTFFTFTSVNGPTYSVSSNNLYPFPTTSFTSLSWTQVSAGQSYTAALTTTGTAYTWGYNANYSLGNGNNTNMSLPVQVSSPGALSTTSSSSYSLYFSANLAANQNAAYTSSNANIMIPIASTTFTIEAWVYQTQFNGGGSATSYYPYMIMDGTYTTSNANWSFGPNYLGQLQFYWLNPSSTQFFATGNTVMNVCTWYHIAVSVNNNAISLYVNGVLQTITGTSTLTARPNTTNTYSLGCIYSGTTYNYWNFYGYVSNLRITNNIAVYTGNFTPPTGPLTLTQPSSTNISAIPSVGYVLFMTGQASSAIDTGPYRVGFSIGAGVSVKSLTPFYNSNSYPTVSWTQIVANYNYFMHGITSTGLLYGWGLNNYGQIGDSTNTQYRSFPVQIGLDNYYRYISSPTQVGTSSWSQVNAGGSLTALIQSVGGTNYGYMLGSDEYGQLATSYLGITSPYISNALNSVIASSPVQIPYATSTVSSPVQIGTSSWTSISVGNSFSLAIRTDGTLWGWGDNSYGQLGQNDIINRSIITQISSSSWKQITTSDYTTVAIRSDGTLWAWGQNSTYGQLGTNDIINRSSPTQISTSSWTFVSTNNPGSIAIRSDNTLWSWGYNGNGQLGDNTTTNRSSPVQISVPSGSLTTVIGSIAMGNGATVVMNGGLPYVIGTNTAGALGLGTNYVPAGTSSPVQLNTMNMFTNAPYTMFTSPTQIMSGSWNQIAAGLSHTLAIRSSDASLWAWGYNAAYQVGDLTNYSRSSPVQISTSSWSSVSGGGSHSVALTGGLLYAWGYNANGQLALGSTAQLGTRITQSSPVQVPTQYTSITTYVSVPIQISSSSWTLVSAGISNGIVTDTTGLLWGWGSTSTGQLYQNGLPAGSANNSNITTMAAFKQTYAQIPQSVGTSSWTSIAAGYRHALAIDINNRLFGWGNYAGTVPATIPYSWAQIASGWSHTLAIKGDGTMWAWGLNTSGQLGTNNLTSVVSPIQIGVGSSWNAVTAGSSHSAAIRSDGVLFTWGDNTYGQLGDNTNIAKSSPIQVGYTITNTSNTNIYNTSFNGSTDYLTVNQTTNTDLGSLNFTLEFWILPKVAATTRVITKRIPSAYSSGSWSVTYNANGSISWSQVTYPEVFTATTAGGVPLNTWTHVAIVRLSGVTELYINGKMQAFVIDNTAYSIAATLYVGTDPTINYFSGLLTNVRIVKGTAVYTSTFTPPTSPLTLITNTTLFICSASSVTNDNAGNTITKNGNPVTSIMPNPFTSYISNTSWAQVSAGFSHTLAITTTYALFGWGLNTSSQVGDTTATNRSSPVQVSSDNSWIQIAAGDTFSVGLHLDSTAWGWGNNGTGQLGYGIPTNSPIQLGALPGQLKPATYSKVAASTQTTYLLRSDGNLFGLGYNGYGQLGNNSTTNASSPVQVGAIWKNIVTSGPVSGAVAGIKFDGTAWVWGQNNYGQLGLNNNVSYSSPVQVGTNLTNVPSGLSFVAFGLYSGFLQDKYGTLYGTGYNTTGVLGTNDTNNRSAPVQITAVYGASSPVQISTGTSWIQVSAGNDISFATNSSNVLYAWGRNDTSQGGTAINSSFITSPVAIGTISQVVIAGNNNSGYIQ